MMTCERAGLYLIPEVVCNMRAQLASIQGKGGAGQDAAAAARAAVPEAFDGSDSEGEVIV